MTEKITGQRANNWAECHRKAPQTVFCFVYRIGTYDGRIGGEKIDERVAVHRWAGGLFIFFFPTTMLGNCSGKDEARFYLY